MTGFVCYSIYKNFQVPEIVYNAWLLAFGYYFGIRAEFDKKKNYE